MTDKQTGCLMEHGRLRSSFQVLHHIVFFNLPTIALCIDLMFQVSGIINKQWEKTMVDGTVPFSMLGIYCYLWDLQAISFPLKFYINVFLFLITLACICWRKPWCTKVLTSLKKHESHLLTVVIKICLSKDAVSITYLCKVIGMKPLQWQTRHSTFFSRIFSAFLKIARNPCLTKADKYNLWKKLDIIIFLMLFKSKSYSKSQ